MLRGPLLPTRKLLMKLSKSFLLAVAALVIAPGASADLVVLQPAGAERVSEGVEFSAYRIGNRWDMADPADVIRSESRFLANETFENGVYRAETVEDATADGLTDARLFLLYPGLADAYNALESGQRHPVTTQDFRYLTLRIRHTPTDGSPSGENHPVQVFYFEDEFSISQGTFGYTTGKNVPGDGDWHVVTFDLVGDEAPNSNYSWDSFETIKGLRIDPTNRSNTRVEIDWVRLTAVGAPADRFEIQWSGGTGPFDVFAQRPGGTPILLADSVTVRSTDADFSRLPPGAYTISVSDAVESATSSGTVNVNAAPLFNFLQPDIRGDTDRSYARVEAGNPWGPIDSGDISATQQLTGISYSNPSGSLTATSTGSDPRITLNTPVAIDTNHYRMLSYTLSVSGARDIGRGSVARVFWGNDPTGLKTSEDIVVQEGLNRYDLGDLRELVLENGATGQWTDSPRILRIDPHEFPEARGVRLDEVVLAPLDAADPSFDIIWSDEDPDDNAQIALFADRDRIPGNGNETPIATGIGEDDPANRFSWMATNDVADGEYFVYATAEDGFNRTVRYATGPIRVGSGAAIDINILQPDGVDDAVVAADEFSRVVEGNAWDMADAGDVPLSRSRNIDNQSVSGGVYSGTSTSNDPFFYLLYPGATDGHDGSNGLLTPIDTVRFRYLTFKVRITAGGPVSFNVYFNRDGNFTPQSTGYTNLQLLYPGEWQVVTVDLLGQGSAGSPFSWSDVAEVVGLRIDPANSPGVSWEFDWFTLTGPLNSGSRYTVTWSASNAEDSVLDVRAVDAMGDAIPMLAGVAPAQGSAVLDFTRFPAGSYQVELDAIPGGRFLSDGAIEVTPATATANDELRNISTRAQVLTGDRIMIGGFIISGQAPKCVVVQGLGPSVGVPDGQVRLPDPVLTLKSGQTTLAQNDNWQVQDDPAHVSIISSLGRAPRDILEAAIYACLPPGAYTALLTDYTNSAGIGLVAVYDSDDGTSYLSNISTRSWVGTGDLISIGGFVINGTTPRKVLVRGLGPTMSQRLPAGTDVLDNPQLRLYAGRNVIATNDNWVDADNAELIAALPAALVPDYAAEPAILITLAPGSYTAHLLGVGGDTGLGNIAVYDLTGK